MRQQLPEAFVNGMRTLLGEQFDAFMASYDAPRLYGLRSNSLKIDPEQWRQQSPFHLRPIPWCETGSYYDGDDRPGKHPYYHAGLYYIQEPSAMAPVELLNVQPGHRVLDLCAAPGGKSTQIAAKLQGKGVLVTNDNAGERTKALAKNIELAGVRNAVVLNEEPASLAPVFAGWFDRILVDAPCSGEGMFRKDESMIASWERHSVERCAGMQRDIVKHASQMLAPGGILVYSTCTFSPAENEVQIADLLAGDPRLERVSIQLAPGFVEGRLEWGQADTNGIEGRSTQESSESLGANEAQVTAGDKQASGETASADGRIAESGMARLWPHLLDGEGHFVAVVRRKPLPVDGQAESDAAAQQAGSREEVLAASEPPIGRGKRDRMERRDEGRAARSGDRSSRGSNGGKGAAAGKHANGGKAGGGAAAAVAVDPAEAWRSFADEHLIGTDEWTGRLVAFGSRVYWQPEGLPSLDGLRVVRAGWYLGDAGRHRFEPSQALALGLRRSEMKRSWSGSADDAAIMRFLKGETLHLATEELTVIGDDTAHKGYTLICVDNYPIGWGKYASGMLKNELPAGWRWV
ncbi:RsmB/NOP family class I SAM-dependent RNA methyltransferase [Paenibacillus sp. PR3]|uniref:RsmB/NOP family class I SAM-dependent RNA methyltransferase n=1 Tax=Paenibacillus terricola TaxID=2763503 RepID=A0ABR8MU82_9BACL|nr:RsmB/NOP family class I SAM-dependent RNA methyltransferase [Paenibacillus terricola]MBD3919523.1 RsmB/NOP family class I SAM-dependent RNA methyltransferase [Paenibacillus terricola]